MVSRKAGEAIQQLFLPNSQKINTSTSPYFYGMDEGTWRNYMDEYHQYVQKGGDNRSQMLENIEDDLRVTPAEAESFYKYSRNPNNKVARHVALGVPHAFASEDLVKTALTASDRPAAFLNTGDHFATDLQVALGKLNQQVDVQNKFRSKQFKTNKDGFAAFNGLRDYVGQTVYNEASAKDTLDTIFNRTADTSGRFNLDKLLQSRGLAKPSEVKDALIGGIYNQDEIRNLALRQNQGTYDVTRPIDMYETDLNKLRSNLLHMTKREFEQLGGGVLSTPRFAKKLQLQIPSERVREMASPDSPYINDEVRQMLIQP